MHARLADGTRRTYWYAWKGGPPLRGQPGSPEFIASYNATVAAKVTPPNGVLLKLLQDYQASEFEGVEPAATGRPSYHPSVLLKLYIYGYLNRVQSSRRLEREAGRNVEAMWLLGRLAPDHKTIADFRKNNGLALRKVCARFVELCREMGLLATASVAIGTKTSQRRRFVLSWRRRQLDTADRQEPTEALATEVTRLTGKLIKLI